MTSRYINLPISRGRIVLSCFDDNRLPDVDDAAVDNGGATALTVKDSLLASNTTVPHETVP